MRGHILINRSQRDRFNEHILFRKYYPLLLKFRKSCKKIPRTSQNFVKPNRIRLDGVSNLETRTDR